MLRPKPRASPRCAHAAAMTAPAGPAPMRHLLATSGETRLQELAMNSQHELAIDCQHRASCCYIPHRPGWRLLSSAAGAPQQLLGSCRPAGVLTDGCLRAGGACAGRPVRAGAAAGGRARCLAGGAACGLLCCAAHVTLAAQPSALQQPQRCRPGQGLRAAQQPACMASAADPAGRAGACWELPQPVEASASPKAWPAGNACACRESPALQIVQQDVVRDAHARAHVAEDCSVTR